VSVDLRFARPRSTSADLAFGAGAQAPATDLSGAATLPPLAASGRVLGSTRLQGAVALPALAAAGTVRYDADAFRGLLRPAAAPWQVAVQARAQSAAPWQAPFVLSPQTALAWQPAAPLAAARASRWRALPVAAADRRAVWQPAAPLAAAAAAPYHLPAARAERAAAAWQDAAARTARLAAPYRHPPSRGIARASAWQNATPAPRHWRARWQNAAARTTRRRAPWQDAGPVRLLWPRPTPYVPPPPVPRTITADLPFACRVEAGAPWVLRFGRICRADDRQPIVIPILRAYIMLHDVSVTRLSDNIAIPARSVTLALDADSAAWSFSAALLGPDAVDAVRPDASGQPVALQIAIDGYTFTALVEDWAEDRSHGQRSVSVKGRGLSAELAAPYQLPSSGVTASDLTVQQVLAAHLPIGSGWQIAWAPGTPDWLVPAGAWSWANQSPLAAILSAATGCGLVVVPDRTQRTLRIQPRYPVLPWALASAAPQITIPESAVLSVSRRNAPPAQANAAFVAGGSPGGVLARVYRDGTAGDRALAPVQHPLITHADAARLLGSRLLAAQAQQPDVRAVTLPLDGNPFGLAAIGDVAQITLGSTATRAIVNAVQIDVQRSDRALTVRQTLTLGEDTPNIWSGFARLLPQDPIRPATVQAAFADGTALVQYPGGGTQRVRNPIAATANASVYVRGDRIDSAAPQLTAFDLTV
jgi:hypothetical protein